MTGGGCSSGYFKCTLDPFLLLVKDCLDVDMFRLGCLSLKQIPEKRCKGKLVIVSFLIITIIGGVNFYFCMGDPGISCMLETSN